MKNDYFNRRFILANVDLEEITAPSALWFRLLNRLYMHLVRWDRSKSIILERRALRAEMEIKTALPDVVICFFSNSDHFFWLMGRVAEAAREANAKVIADYHAGGFNVFWDSLSPRKQAIARKVLQSVDLVLVRNKPASEFFNRIIPGGNVKTIFNPAPTDYFRPASRPQQREEGDQIQIAFMGVGSPHNKGAFVLLDAILPLLDRIRTVRIVMAGPDKTNIAATLKNRNQDIQQHVQLTGLLSVEDVRRLYQESDILVMPSYSEGFPCAMIEAMSYGLACIGSRVGAIPEILAGGDCGLLIDPGDSMQLASALMCLAEDGELRERLGRAARKRVEDHYAIPHFERAFEYMVNSVLLDQVKIRPRDGENGGDIPC